MAAASSVLWDSNLVNHILTLLFKDASVVVSEKRRVRGARKRWTLSGARMSTIRSINTRYVDAGKSEHINT